MRWRAAGNTPARNANGSTDPIVLIAAGLGELYCRAMTRTIAIGFAVLILSAGTDAAELDLDKVAGLYVAGFMNGNNEGYRYWSDDVLEIVKLSSTTAYFRTHLKFFNGHQCSLWGIAEVTEQSLIYRDPELHCELHLDIAGGKITFDDRGYHCREQSCGARGVYNRASFKLSARRPIRYMQTLMTSSEYQDALNGYKAQHRQ